MMEYPPQRPQQPQPQPQQQQPSTPQRTVLMLSPTGGKSDYSRLLPPPAKLPSAAAKSWKASKPEITSLPTLTPERVQQKLQTPRRITALKPTVEVSESASQYQTRISAFTSPQQQQQQQQQRRRLPTEMVLADGELSYFTRVTDLSSSSLNLNKSMESVQFELPQNLRPVNQSFLNSPQRTTANGSVSIEYISPATTPARSENDNDNVNSSQLDGEYLLDNGDAFSSVNNISSERHIVDDSDVAGMVIPVKASAGFTAPSTTISTLSTTTPAVIPQSHAVVGSGVILVNQPVHLLEQQHEQLLIQQEQELLQRQLQREFYEEEQQYDRDEERALQQQLQDEFQDEQNLLSRLEYQFHQIDEASGKDDLSMHPSTFLKFTSTEASAGDIDPEQVEQTIVQQDPSWRTDPTMRTDMGNPLEDNDVQQNLFNQDFSLRIEKMVEELNMEGTIASPDEEALPDLNVSESSEPSNSVQKQVVERMMAITPAKEVVSSSCTAKRNRRSSTAPRICRERNTSTPRISNSSSGSESDAVSMEDDIKNQYEIEKKWPIEAVDSLKSTMTRAVGKLKTLATHISKNSNDSVPDAVNTSAESSSSSTDPDTNSGFDITDLAGELRNNKIESQSQLSYENNEGHEAHHQRRNSATSFDTVGAPKPASLAQTSVPPTNLQKPVPFNPAKASPRLPPPSKKKSDLLNNKNGQYFFVSKPVADNRTRAVTPIVRMRNQGASHIDTTLEEAKQTPSADDIASLKQKNWRDKTKNVKKTRERDKSKLVGEDEKNLKHNCDTEKKRQAAKKTRFKVRKNRREPSFFVVAGHKYQIPNGIPTCKGDVIELIERFMSTRCGNLDDTYDGDEEGDEESLDSNELSFYSDDYESGSESETSTVDKQPEKAVLESTARSQAVTLVEEKVPKHTITVDINDKQFIRQFIATATTEGIVLLSHMKNRSKALRRPSKNTIYLRRGTQSSSGNFVGPKLVWKDVKGDEGGEIDLFTIRSLEKATVFELENYPYAMPGRSLFLRLNEGEDYVFEARSESEALRFVHGMRWLIARLAFNLIIGNVSVSCELLDVGETTSIDDRYGMFPRSVKEETQWTMAMNEATTHLVQEVSKSIH